ncbi:MAG: DUF3667 domain-containing protein [Ekhidna sp.]
MKTQACISCGNEFSGIYCNECGEKVIHRDDRKLKYFLGEFVNAITFADSKFWRTLKYILIKPGKFSRDFVDGKRNAYMRPVSVFFFANLIYFLFPLFNTFNNNLQTQIGDGTFIHSSIANELVKNEIEERNISFQEYEIIYNIKTSELSKMLLIIMAVFLALFFALIHYPERHPIADHMVASLELMTFVVLFAIQLQGLIIYFMRRMKYFTRSEWMSELTISAVALVMLIYFFMKMERNFYKASKQKALLNTILCIGSFIVVLYAYRAMLFFVTFWSI